MEGTIAKLRIKDIEESLYKKIKELAASENRSVSQQALFLIKEYLSRQGSIKIRKSPAQTLLALAGSWEDNRTAEKIISEIKRGRKYRDCFVVSATPRND